jgi:type II secretory pathway component PulF
MMANIEDELREVTKQIRKGNGPGSEAAVSLDAQNVVVNLIKQRDKVNELFNEMIRIASEYKRECDAFVIRVQAEL